MVKCSHSYNIYTHGFMALEHLCIAVHGHEYKSPCLTRLLIWNINQHMLADRRFPLRPTFNWTLQQSFWMGFCQKLAWPVGLFVPEGLCTRLKLNQDSETMWNLVECHVFPSMWLYNFGWLHQFKDLLNLPLWIEEYAILLLFLFASILAISSLTLG